MNNDFEVIAGMLDKATTKGVFNLNETQAIIASLTRLKNQLDEQVSEKGAKGKPQKVS